MSDMLTDSIYRLSDNRFELWLQNRELTGPTGLLIEDDRLLVGAWGRMVDGFSTEVAGHIKSVSLLDKTINSLGNGKAVGNLDGLEPAGPGRYYVTDWMNGGLFKVDRNGDAEKLLPLAQGSADHEVITEQAMIVIPMMMQNKLVAYKLN